MTDAAHAPQHQRVRTLVTADDGLPASADPTSVASTESPLFDKTSSVLSADQGQTMTMPVISGDSGPFEAHEWIDDPLPATTVVQSAAQVLTCPECGTVATVTVTRRESGDFCRKCDYPLFWVPSRIELDRSNISNESLRRLPGTVGRATVASLACPHCAELNAVNAENCVRCGRPMQEVAQAPIVESPVYVAPPPEPVIEPDPRWAWWVWVLIVTGLLVVATGVTIGLLYWLN
jgi:hypothetical protein